MQQTNQDTQTQLLTARLDAIKESSQPMTFDKTVEMMKTTHEMFGGNQGATDQDLAIAQITAETRLKEYELNLDARKMAEEAKSENMRWQQIGGLLTTVAGVAAPSIMNAVTGGAQALGPQPMAQPHQQQAQYPQQQVDEPGVRYAALRCTKCNKTFEVKSDADGAFGDRVRCPYCKSVLEVDLNGTEEDSSGP
jgi:phage FluMu protein Com